MEPGRILSRKRKKKDSKLSFILTMVILFGILFVLLYIYINYYFLGGRAKSYISKGKPIAVLFLGLDEAFKHKRTDTMLIGIYNPLSKRFGVISIPRDLRLKVETKLGLKPEKANTIYARYGLKKLIKVLEDFTGLEIPYYAIMEIEGFVKIVDLLGGIEIFVEKPMKYIDNAANLYIEIPRGVIKCDGLKAMEFIRFRADERGDIGRIERQFEFIINVVRKAIIEKNILTNIKLLKLLLKYIDTNINFQDLINLIRNASDADLKNIEMMRIPGKFVKLHNIDFIEPDEEKTKNLIKKFMNRLSHIKGRYLPSEIKVQVLNGSGKSGVARAVRDKLVRNGFNVVEFGNADFQDYEQTVILDRTGNIKKSLYVARVLNCGNVYPKINHFILVDVTVIVGKDYKKILR